MDFFAIFLTEDILKTGTGTWKWVTIEAAEGVTFLYIL
jgi:hypothetical protein